MQVTPTRATPSDGGGAGSPPDGGGGAAAAPSAPAPVAAADLALVIQPDTTAGHYIYKTVDRRTGQVISQFPDEEVVRMRDAATYAPGGIIRQSA